MSNCARAIFICLLLAAATSIVQAQTNHTSSINGTVTSSNGAVLPNNTIQLVNLDNKQTLTTKSDAAGLYRFDNIAPGRYHMIAMLGGQAAAPSAEITVPAGEAITVNLTVSPGGNGSKAPAAASNPTNPVTSIEASSVQGLAGPRIETTFNTRDIQYLPSPALLQPNGEMFGAYNLSLLPAGVVSNGGIGPGRAPVVGGQWPTASNFYIDGVDNNNRANPGPSAIVSNEATSEFITQQNQYSPEYGHAAGGQFNLLLRTGSNNWHGAISEYFQNRNLGALNQSWVNGGLINGPRYDQNRLGGNLGGPIIHDKLFFFADFEYIPLGFDAIPNNSIFAPTAAGYATLAGVPGVSGNNLGVLQRFLPAAQNATNFVNVNSTQIPVGNVALLGRSFQNQYNGVGALDWKIGQNDKLQFRYVQNQRNANFNGAELPEFFAPASDRSIVTTVDEVHDFNGRAINELRFGYTRFENNILQNPLTFGALGVFPTINIQELGFTLGTGVTGIDAARLNTYNYADNFHWISGRHTFRFGVDGRRYTGPMIFGGETAGTFNYSTLSGFLSNLPPDVSGARTVGNLSFPTNQWDTYAYAKDDWKMRSNMMISLGVRYEYVSLPLAEERQSLNFGASVPGSLVFGSPGTQTTNFAPQVGFAYSPGQNLNSVFRAGFGMNYDVATYIATTPFLTPGLSTTLYTNNLPAVPGFFGTATTPGAFFTNSATAGLTPQSASTGFFPNQRVPYTMQWNASWEQTVLHSFLLSVGYLGVRGVHYPVGRLLNGANVVTATNSLPIFTTAPSQATLNGLTPTLGLLQAEHAAANPLAAMGFTSPVLSTSPGGSSIYNALLVQARQRFSGGFQFLAAYTWSHLIDNIDPFASATPFFGLFQQGPRESSIYDHRQRGTFTALWDVGAIGKNGPNWLRDIVANFNISGTYIYETSAFLPIQSGLDPSLNGFSNSGVFFNAAGVPGVGSSVSPLTNSAGQVVGYLANNPNAQFIRPGLGSFVSGPATQFGFRPINDWDASVVKRFSLFDKANLEFRADAFNILNHPQFTPGSINSIGLPGQSFGNLLVPGFPSFANAGQAFGSNPRMLQLALRLMF